MRQILVSHSDVKKDNEFNMMTNCVRLARLWYLVVCHLPV